VLDLVHHCTPEGGLGAFVGRHGWTNPAGRVCGPDNMRPKEAGEEETGRPRKGDRRTAYRPSCLGNAYDCAILVPVTLPAGGIT
jgi:hypothetical protein